jgi:hypothetical protein
MKNTQTIQFYSQTKLFHMIEWTPIGIAMPRVNPVKVLARSKM